MENIKLFARIIRPHPSLVILLIFLGLIAAGLEGIGIGLLIPLFDTMTDGVEVPSQGNIYMQFVEKIANTIPTENRQFGLCILILLFIVFKLTIVYAISMLSTWFNGLTGKRLRDELCDRFLHADYGLISSLDRAKLMNAIAVESWRISRSIELIFSICTKFCVILVFICLLFIISWPLSIVTISGVLIILTSNRIITNRVGLLSDKSVLANRNLAQNMMQLLDAMRIIRIFGQESKEEEDFKRNSEQVRTVFLRMYKIFNFQHPFNELQYFVLIFVIILFGGSLDAQFASTLVFLILLYRLQPHVRGLDRDRVELASVKGAIEEVAGLIRFLAESAEPSGHASFSKLSERIVFKNVFFAYPSSDGKQALNGASFMIPKAKVTALVGESGSGKSTTINLLCRLFRPTAGSIFVDREPIENICVDDWRKSLAFAGQDAELIDGSIAENIAYGRPTASLEEIIRAAREVGIDALIEDLPQRYETLVGPRGVRLSGGQRQRISLARALLRHPDTLILDEATNALDSISELEIQKTLQRLAGQLTIIIIAHRLSTIQNADNVVVLKDGRVVEEGSPDNLLASSGHFAKLFQSQAAELDTATPT